MQGSAKPFFLVLVICLVGAWDGAPCIGQEAAKVLGQHTEIPKKEAEKVKVLPSPDEKLSPIETETIDEAGEAISKKIDQIEKAASRSLGEWVLAEVYPGVTWPRLVLFIVWLLLILLVDRLFRFIIGFRIQRLRQKNNSRSYELTVLDALSKPLSLFIWAYGFYFSSSHLLVHMRYTYGVTRLPDLVAKGADIFGAIAVMWFLYRLVRVVDIPLAKWASSTDSKTDDMLVRMMGKALRVFIVFLASYVILQNLTGIEFYPLIAPLGLGALAIALAAKESVSNFLGTLAIMFDKPFHVGDSIEIDEYNGTVEFIGFRSTGLRTATGSLVQIPNEKVISSAVENISRRPYIRWHTRIGIRVDTSPEKVSKALGIIREVLKDHEGMNIDRPPKIFLDGVAEWSLNVSVHAWYYPAEYWSYSAWVEEMWMEIMRRFDVERIKLADRPYAVDSRRIAGNS